MVKYLQHDGFINLEGMIEEQWISRDVVPMRPEELQQKSRDLYNAFEKRIKRK